MVDERIAARRAEVREDRRRRRLRRTVLVTVLLVLGVVAVLVERSSLVALAEVRVEGTRRLAPATVRTAADLEPGTSTLRLPLERARERVEQLPLVATAEVRRLDPLTVLVDVTERVPTAVVVHGRRSVLVDADGVVVAEGREQGLPVIEVTGEALPDLGAAIRRAPAAANAHAALAALPGPVRSLVATYVAEGPDDLQLQLLDGTRVRVGRAERVDEKARALGAVLTDLDGRAVEEIDVRAPGRPVVVPTDP